MLGLDEMNGLGLIERILESSIGVVLLKVEGVVVEGRRKWMADVRLRHGVDSKGEG